MKNQLLFVSIILIAIVIIGGFLIYQPTRKNNPYDFTPSITQGIYGTALECYGSAEPPSKGDWSFVQISFKIKNLETDEVSEIKTLNNGRYEYSLKEGSYMIIAPISGEEINYAEIYIEKDSLIKQNIVIKFCPV